MVYVSVPGRKETRMQQKGLRVTKGCNTVEFYGSSFIRD